LLALKYDVRLAAPDARVCVAVGIDKFYASRRAEVLVGCHRCGTWRRQLG